ncbi:MAG: sigma-70 family RNA polymerase sigma factor [Oscillospiraceae bacterium]|nr:sigma-70 family RNA polymerase sigma factor [Oscillospiraceae bacterium]
MTDTAIIELYWARSEQAIAESENAYGRFCYRVANGILRDSGDAEESVNDTWLASWNAIPPTRPQSLHSFFGALCRRISVSRLRARLADKRGGGEALLAIEELSACIPAAWSTEGALEERELVAAFNAFLARQPKLERDLFVARYWYGLPMAELAAKFGLKRSTAATKLRRCRLRLLDYLEKGEYL